MTDNNPYWPPESDLGLRRNPGRFKPVVTVVRVLIALWSLFILAGQPWGEPDGNSRARDIAAKALGALLFLLAVFPFGPHRAGQVKAPEGQPEDL